MLKSRVFRGLATTALLLASLSGIILMQVPIMAQTQPTATPSPTPQPQLTLDCRYPAAAVDVGASVSYDVDIKYYGTERLTFNLVATAPSGWTAAVLGSGSKQITSIQIAAPDANTPGIETVTVSFTPDFQALPAAGTYTGSIKVTSGTLSQSVDMRTTVTSKYNFALQWTDPSTGSATTDVTMLGAAGKAATFPFDVNNTGSAEVKNLTFSAEAPKGWTVTFSPASLSTLSPNQQQPVSAIVTPASGNNMAGDYVLSLKGDNGAVSAKMTLRISIPPSTTSVWLIVGVAAVIILVLVGAYQFLGKKRSKAIK